MQQPTGMPPMRARRSRHRQGGRGFLRVFLALLLVALLGVGGFVALHTNSFLGQFGNPFEQFGRTIAPPAGSVPWKLQHGQQVNVLLLGYGGAENDAPYLTDTMMVLALDPAGRRAMEVSIPRDLQVRIDAFANHQPASEKINAAYEIGMDDGQWRGKRPEFTGVRGRGGQLAMRTVTSVTGLQFDGYVAVDFKAFRDLVNDLGGVQVCLDAPLDDYQYPDYHNGYVRGGIHFKAGCQQVNGEQALELARSRHAEQADQATDFARAHRQQLLLNAIRKKATSVNAIGRAPEIMNTLQQDLDTSLGLSDLKAVYDWSTRVPEGAIERAGISTADFLGEYYLSRGTCGDFDVYTLCPIDPTFRVIQAYFAHLFVDPAALKEQAPVQIANGSRTLDDLGERVSSSLAPLGFKMTPPTRVRQSEQTVVYDYSGGRYPMTASWLETYFGASAATPSATPAPSSASGGLVVVLGHDYALRWIGEG